MPVWDLSAAFVNAASLDVSGQDTQPQDATLAADGTKVYVIGGGNHIIYQYGLTTAWDLASGSYASKSFDTGSQDISPNGIAFKPDGLKMYVSAGANRSVFQYTLGTAWDMSTVSYASKFINIAGDANQVEAVDFSTDGTKMFIIGVPSHIIYQYTLSTPWDVSTATYASKSFDVSSQDTAPKGVRFKPGGLVMFVIGDTNNTVYQYNLGTAWDMSTASYASISFSVSAEATAPTGLAFRADTGESLYVPAITGAKVYEYTLGVASAGWTVGSLRW